MRILRFDRRHGSGSRLQSSGYRVLGLQSRSFSLYSPWSFAVFLLAQPTPIHNSLIPSEDSTFVARDAVYNAPQALTLTSYLTRVSPGSISVGRHQGVGLFVTPGSSPGCLPGDDRGVTGHTGQ